MNNKRPTIVRTYAELGELMEKFTAGHIRLILIQGSPGLCKSQHIRKAIDLESDLYIRGHKPYMRFYIRLYEYQDKNIVLDDVDPLLEDKRIRHLLKALTESDDYKKLEYDNPNALKAERVPPYFHTSSKVAIIVNEINWKDQIIRAIASRAMVIELRIPWAELHKHVGEWYWDQEIYDYIGERLDTLTTPDARLYILAHDRKMAGMKKLTWQKLIDDACDDNDGLLIRKLLANKKIKSNDARAKEWCDQTGHSRATFYRKFAEIREYNSDPIANIKLKFTEPPKVERPADAPVPGGFDEEEEEEEYESEEE